MDLTASNYKGECCLICNNIIIIWFFEFIMHTLCTHYAHIMHSLLTAIDRIKLRVYNFVLFLIFRDLSNNMYFIIRFVHFSIYAIFAIDFCH